MKTESTMKTILVVSLIFICNFPLFGKTKEIPDSLEHLFHNNFYLRYSHGMNIYFIDARNGFLGYSTKEIRYGMTLEPEIGTFIKNVVQIGVSAMYLDGKSDDTLNYGDYHGYGYDDVYFMGASLKARYFLVNNRHIKVPVGIEAFGGACGLRSGITNDKTRTSAIHNINAMSSYDGAAYGGGISGSFSYYPFWFLSIGVDLGIRVLLSQKLKAGFVAPDNPYHHEGDVTLNLSSVVLKGYLSAQF
jgi:hypothetical protein